MKDSLEPKTAETKAAGIPENPGESPIPHWFWTFSSLAIASSLVGILYFMDRLVPEQREVGEDTIGHVVRGYGTVKQLTRKGGLRLESGRELHAPISLGDQIHTGEESVAQILFRGGSTLQLQPGSVVRFEDRKDDVSIRLIMGSGYFELPSEGATDGGVVFRDADGKPVNAPTGKRLLISMNAARKMKEAIEMRVIAGERTADPYPLIVPPLDGRRAQAGASGKSSRVGAPKVIHPAAESFIDINENHTASFRWAPVRGPASDPVVGYEVIVRPAFKYEVEDTARKRQGLKSSGESLGIVQVDGGGVFLWSVRAVTQSGAKGASSEPQWLELKFPKLLVAPSPKKPKVE